MAMKARYTVVNGEIIAEKRSGVRSLYVPDPLGSTRGLINNAQTQTDTFSYWPYGEQQSRTGTTTTPFQFVGTLGYHLDSGQGAKTYVRARYLNAAKGRWITRDPFGLEGDYNLYRYVENRPTNWTDPYGLQAAICIEGGPQWDCSNWPGGPCDFAKKRGLDGGNAGGVICCNGRQYACDWTPPGGQPGFHICVKAHETCHFGQITCPPTGLSPGKFDPGESAANDECQCHQAQVDCLRRHQRTDCGKTANPAACNAAYKNAIDGLCYYMFNELWCKCE